MSNSNPNPAPNRRWLTWQPGGRIIEDSGDTEPTKPSEPGFDGFDGSSQSESAKIHLTLAHRNSNESPQLEVDLSTASERVMSWAEWKAGALNELFLELGTAGQPGRIAADTILHGEQMWMKKRDIMSQKAPRPQ
jgi:hypothetical protein